MELACARLSHLVHFASYATRHPPRAGGGTDINLVAQDAALNVSAAWRRLERWAQARPGSFLAIEVTYDDDSQTPARFVYLVAAERELRYERFANR